MKKIKYLIPVLVLALIAALFAFADSPEQPKEPKTYEMQGTVLEITDNGILLETADLGEVLVKTDAETVLDMQNGFTAGDYLFVQYDGMMTRSVPAQITADLIRMYLLEGDVVEIYADENAVLLSTTTHGEVYVTLPEGWNAAELDAPHIRVYFDGVMTLSIPARVNAAHVIPGYALQGTVTEIGDGFILISQEGDSSVQVNFSEGTLPETVDVGALVRVLYDGKMTFSIPAQVYAMEIVQLSRCGL